MTEAAINRLQFLCDVIPPLLNNMEEEEFSYKPLPHKWSKKEIMGHLVDSATNNHQRFVRGQFEQVPKIKYDQNKWNAFSYYQQMDKSQVIAVWAAYNKFLLELIKRIPGEQLLKRVDTGAETSLTIEFLIQDYVSHMEHHLRQVVNY
jgi:DinB superfamily